MSGETNVQKLLFEAIKTRLSSHLSMVDAVAGVLNISSDSSYRRIRGEKLLSLIEAEKLAMHFNLSLDGLLGIVSNSVTFQKLIIDEEDLNFHKYLESLIEDMIRLKENPHIEVIFQLNELNLYHVSQFPELLAFKIYFWSKSSLDFKSFSDKKFSLSMLDDKILKLSSELSQYYANLNTTELLTEEFLNSFLKQIEFYFDSGFFENNEDAVSLCYKAIELIEHLRKQAELGYKFPYGINPPGFGGEFKLYSNNLTLVDNVILVGANGEGMTYITNGAINLLATADQKFYNRNRKMAQNIMKRSTLISHHAERERNLFFNTIKEEVTNLIERLANHKRF